MQTLWTLSSFQLCFNIKKILMFMIFVRGEQFPTGFHPENRTSLYKRRHWEAFYLICLKISLGYVYKFIDWKTRKCYSLSTLWLLADTSEPLPFMHVLRTALIHIQIHVFLLKKEHALSILNFTSILSNIY